MSPPYPRDDFKYDNFPKPWLYGVLQSAGNPFDTWRTGYLYVPHSTNDGKVRYIKLNQVPKDRCLSIENMFEATTVAHPSKSGPAWNLVFKDGHVAPAVSQFMLEVMQGKHAADPLGSIAGGNCQKDFEYTGRTSTSISSSPISPNFDTYRDILETVADGRNPKTSTVGGGLPMSNARVKFNITPVSNGL